ncbi:hypothetical protein LAZ67_7002330 [Cordylochernes scorpioides]|uniref:Mos1 transposase HTH domain-containing protein n=1 Tax=Cordylochernes scorpioides TaxID=51811 RepID=A0ABY6KPQ2_9ARAC|nr:hypothetical protein LAZ67_7002330 [Cordylochernes scorpioides]
MERSLEQRYAIMFCVRLGKNATETFQMLQKAFKDDCISRSQSGKWHKAFKEGWEEVADEPRSGRPTTARTDKNVDRVLEVLRTDRRLRIQQIADTLHMSTFVVHGIVTEDLQMQLRVLRCQELLDLIQNEPDFLNSVVTGDESWMFEYPESKRQSCAWHTKSSPRPKKARMSKSFIKTIIIVFFDIRGIVHCEFVPQGQTVHSTFYLEVLRRFKRRIARVRTDIKDTVKLHHDNVTSHTAFINTNLLARSNTPVIPHPPYSPDLAPFDFFLFPRLKREMKGKHWETVENIQHHVTTFLRSIPVEEFQGASQAWQTSLLKCIDAGGMDRTGVTLKHCSMAYWLKVITALLIIGCIELNPGPKRQATLTNIPHSTPDQAPMDDLKLLIINLSAEVNRLGEKMDARLLNIEQKMEDWERRMTGIETSIASCTDALATNTRSISHNTLKIKNLEERAEALERRARENNLIIYGIESAETDSRELLL